MTAIAPSPASRDVDDGAVAALAARVGLTEGQVYTYVIGIALALIAAVGALPPALRDRAEFAAEPIPAPPANAPLAGGSAEPTDGGSSTIGADSGARGSSTTPAIGRSSTPTAASADTTATQPGTPPLSVGTVATFARIGAPGAPSGIAFAPNGTIYVTTDNGTARGVARTPSRVMAFSPNGRTAATVTIDGQPSDHATGLAAAALDPHHGHLAVVDSSTARVISVDFTTGNQTVLAAVPDLAACVLPLGGACEPGVLDHPPALTAAAFGADGTLYVADAGQATIWRLLPEDDEPEAWHQSIDYATGDGPAGLAVSPDGSLELTVGTGFDAASPAAGGLYRISVEPHGSAGARTLVAPFGPDDRPGAVAIGASGTSYVVLRGPGTIVAVDSAGTVSPLPIRPSADIPLDGPAGLALGSGRLFVANQSIADDPAHWAILAITVDDAPAPRPMASR